MGVGGGGGSRRGVSVSSGEICGYQPISHPVWTGRSHAKFTEPKLTRILRTVGVSMTKTSLLIKRGGSEHDQNFASNKAGRQ